MRPVMAKKQLSAYQHITALAVYDNGTGEQLYGMTPKLPDKGSRLFRWNDVGSWEEMDIRK